MNFPHTVDNRVVNNIWMTDYTNEYNYDIAFQQFMDLYTKLVKETGALIYLLPSAGDFQDLPYVANIGCYLPHLEEPTIVISNYKSEPRMGEEKIGLVLFESMGYTVIRPETTLEGEADLKFVRDNIYVGGYGMRTDLRSHYWLMNKTGAEILPIEMSEPRSYHFDCLFFPLSKEKAMVVTKQFKSEELRKLEKIVEVVDVPEKRCYDTWTNSLIIGKKVFHFQPEADSAKECGEFFAKLGYEPIHINLLEFCKSGAGLSCMLFHLNYWR